MRPSIANIRLPKEIRGDGPEISQAYYDVEPNRCVSCEKPTTNSATLSNLRRAFCYTCWRPFEEQASAEGIPAEQVVIRAIDAAGGRARFVPPNGPHPVRNCVNCKEPQLGSAAVEPKPDEVIVCLRCLPLVKAIMAEQAQAAGR